MELLGSHRKLFKRLGILLVGIPGIASFWAGLLLEEPLIPYLIKKAVGLDMSNNIWLIALPFVLMALGVLLLFLIWRAEKITKEKVNPQIAQVENKDDSKEKRPLKLDLVKLFHDGKDCHSKLKRAQNNTDINEQVTAQLYFEAWFSDVTDALKNTDFEEIWYENKVVDDREDQLSEYLSASDRALERLESIIELISHGEGSQSQVNGTQITVLPNPEPELKPIIYDYEFDWAGGQGYPPKRSEDDKALWLRLGVKFKINRNMRMETLYLLLSSEPIQLHEPGTPRYYHYFEMPDWAKIGDVRTIQLVASAKGKKWGSDPMEIPILTK